MNWDNINFTDDLIRAEIARRMRRPVEGTMTIRDNRSWPRTSHGPGNRWPNENEPPPVPPPAQMIDENLPSSHSFQTPHGQQVHVVSNLDQVPLRTGDVAVVGTATTPEVLFDLRPVKLQWAEFLTHHTAAKSAKQFMDEFKILLRGIAGDATALTLAGRQVATFRRDGKLNLTRLRAEQPDLVARYTRIVAEEKFDEAAFLRNEPDVHAAYRGESLRLTDKLITP